MNTYVLDTDELSLFQFNHPMVVANVTRHRSAGDRIALAVITIEEQSLGRLAALRKARGHAALADAYRALASAAASWGQFEILPFPVSALMVFDQLTRSVPNVGRNDLKIAAIALDLVATVVTRNRRDFGRVPGLPIEDWSV